VQSVPSTVVTGVNFAAASSSRVGCCWSNPDIRATSADYRLDVTHQRNLAGESAMSMGAGEPLADQSQLRISISISIGIGIGTRCERAAAARRTGRPDVIARSPHSA
jgi:hypothetical protein